MITFFPRFRVAGNAAYIFGTLAEHGHGQIRVMSLINGDTPQNILSDLTTMLEYDDTESVMNAAGTLGTLVSRIELRVSRAQLMGVLGMKGRGWCRVGSVINADTPQNVLSELTTMLEYDDTESVMNAAGTLGTLVSRIGLGVLKEALGMKGRGWCRLGSIISADTPWNILSDLTTMLENDDTESIMNAAGTIGTLVSTCRI